MNLNSIMEKKSTKILYDILMGILPVMIGVYLGIYFNNRNEASKQEKLNQKVLESIYQECQLNKAALEESLLYFKRLRDSTNYSLKMGLPYKQYDFWEGLNPPQLNNTSFKVAQMTNALPNFSIDLLQLISMVYGSAEDLNLQAQAYFQSVTNKMGTKDFTDEQYQIILFNYAYDMVVAEQDLINSTNFLIEKIEEVKTTY